MTQKISPLRQRMIEDMTIRGLTEKTQKQYIRHIKLDHSLGTGHHT